MNAKTIEELICQVSFQQKFWKGVWQNFCWKDTGGDSEHRLGFSPSTIIEKYMIKTSLCYMIQISIYNLE